jgi:hypothetical protein
MNPLVLEILPLVRQGYCCSQLLMFLLLQSLGRNNPELIRAMHSLCYGMGGSDGPCGLLTGGACVLGCVAGRGKDSESAHPAFVPLVHDYQQWFAGRTEKYGGAACFQVMQGLSAETGVPHPAEGEQPKPSLCGDFFAECWERLRTLLEEYEIPLERR